MAVYIKVGEIQSSLGILVSEYVQDCIRNQKLSHELIELIRHNFLAKYVYFDKQKMTVEIGIHESEERRDYYPKMKVYTFPLDTATEWLGSSFKSGKADLEFYGRLLNNNRNQHQKQVVFL